MPRLLASACLAVVAGLAPPGTTAAPIPTHLMPKDPPFAYPTRVGTTWVYDVGGTEETIVISRVEEKDGAKLVTTEYVGAGGKRTPHMVVAVSGRGVFLVSEGGSAYDAPWCVLKLPPREGETWDTDVRQGGNGILNGTRTTGPREAVKVPAGRFDAVRVDWRYGGNGATFWYAAGVGLVRLDGTKALKSFTPGED